MTGQPHSDLPEGIDDPQCLIERFDGWFDVRLEHDRCLNALRDLGVFSLNAADPYRALSLYVGARWCEMVKWDVLYELRRGALVRDESWVCAHLLEKWTDERLPIPPDPAPQAESFAINVLARWFDAAGKLHYRNKSYTDARQVFEQALAWARKGGHWFLLPDLGSNHARADFEEQRTAGRTPDLAAAYLALLGAAARQAEAHDAPLPREIEEIGCREPLSIRIGDSALRREHREFLRGVCSILHNLSLAEEQGDLAASLAHSRQSEEIAEVLADDYRLAQAVNQQARILSIKAESAREDRREFLDEAGKLFARVRKLGWRRGRLIAWQQSAVLQARSCDRLSGVLESVAELRRLLATIKSGPQFASGEQSADLEAYDYTVQALGAAANRLRQWSGDRTERARQEAERLAAFLEEEELALARAVRSVVKVGVYKQDYNRKRAPVYRQQVLKHIRKGDLAKGLALLEESSGRELLDILALDAIPGSEGELSSFAWEWPNEEQGDLGAVPGHARARQNGPAPMPLALQSSRRSGLRRLQDEDAEPRRKLLEAAMLEYERDALKNPIPVTQADPEITHKVQELSKREPGFAMVRYVSYRKPEIHGDLDRSLQFLGAFVIRRGEISFHELDCSLAERALQEMTKPGAENPGTIDITPNRALARLLWDALLAPLWGKVEPAPGDLPRHLVLVPHGDLFQVPLHLAMQTDESFPLAARLPLVFSVSATMHLAARRYLRRWLHPRAEDDLFAVAALNVEGFPKLSGEEILGVDWDPRHLHMVGDRPEGLDHRYLGAADWNRLEKVSEITPEYLVVSCHGSYDPLESQGGFGPTLNFGREIPHASQFDIARRLRLQGNQFTALAACVSGQGAGQAGGDVAGFVRAFIAAGAGALGVTLFSVRDDEIAYTVQDLLRATRRAIGKPSLDIAGALQRGYAKRCRGLEGADDRLDACPLVIYL